MTNSVKIRTAFAIGFCIIINFIILSLSFAYNVESDGYAFEGSTSYGGHEQITDWTIDALDYGDNNLKLLLKSKKVTIKNANAAEDKIPQPLTHFYNPDLLGSLVTHGLVGLLPNAKLRAKSYYSRAVWDYRLSSTSGAWENLGHALHLLQDMASPSHANSAMHFSHYRNKEGYEWWVTKNWNKEIQPYLTKLFIDNPQFAYIIKAGDMGGYIDTMATQTKYGGYGYDWEGLGPRVVVDDYDAEYNAKLLLPMIIRLGGGLLKTFCEEVNCTGPTTPSATGTPGGDHPDDNFDISSRLVDLEEMDPTKELWKDLYSRTGLKKGYVGLFLQKNLSSLYQNVASSRTDEEFEQNLATFQVELSKATAASKHTFEETYYGSPDVALLSNGFIDETANLLLKRLKEPIREIKESFDPKIMATQPVLVIPSGALYGMEGSTFLKLSLAEYVKQGGTLVVFAQQHGYEFNILPVPQEADGTFKTVTGYGWTEDQSCFTNAVYIDTYHQILSGQNRSTPTLNVDGYFTSFPSNATVILRRTANGQPSMLMYDYGQGKVIVTSMYSDFAYSHNQSSSEELALIRDMISWAKAPSQLPEIKPGQSVQVQVEVKNNTTIDAASAKLLIYNPDRTNLLSEQLIAVGIPAGSSSQLTTQHSTLTTASLGIYHIDYELYDANGSLIQPQAETDSGRFVVSNPPADQYKGAEINFAVNSDSEHYLYGSDATFTVTIWNNSDVERTITSSYFAYHLNVSGSPKTITVPARSSKSFQVIASNITWEGWLVVKFYDENNKYITERWKGIWMDYPSVDVDLKADQAIYGKGEIVNLALNLQNKQSYAYATTVKVKVSDPSNTSIYSNIMPITLAANGASTQSLSFILPQTSLGGFYVISAEINDSAGRKIGGDSISFELPLSQIGIVPTISTLSTGTNTIPFTLTNTGKIGVDSGLLAIILKDPDGIVVYAGNKPFALAVGQISTLNFPVSIPSPKFGNYTLTHAQSDETKTGRSTSIIIPNATTITLSFDKSSYRIREVANFVINLSNIGKFSQDNVSVQVSVPDAGYTNIQTVSVQNGSQLNYSIQIPETINAGQHDVNVTLALPSGSSIAQSSKFTIPESSLVVGYSGSTTLMAGDTITFTVENTGGVDTAYTTEKFYVADNKGWTIFEKSAAGDTLAGEKKTFAEIQIPDQTEDGLVSVYAQIKNNRTLELFYFYQPFEISGLSASLITRTEKNTYLKTENITGIPTIWNSQPGIRSGSLKISVTRTKISTGEFRIWGGGAGSGSGQFSLPVGITLGSDNAVYVADTGNHRIQKFDINGNFIASYGNEGNGDGQFSYPWGISTGPDGSIYVADTNNHRIQKFDSNGNFIAKWGSYGDNNGQFEVPWDIAVGPDGSVYVVDRYLRSIQKFNKDGNFITKWGGYGSGFLDPSGIAAGPTGYIYVTELEGNCITKFDSNGNFIFRRGGSYNAPRGIAVGVDDSIYLADTYNRRILKLNNNGALITQFGSGQSRPFRIAVAPDGTIYVTDSLNNRIQKMDPSGGGTEKLFETSLPITQSANTTQDYTTAIGILNATGKLYLNAELKNSIGQIIATSEYPFYIVEGTTLLLYSTDKKFYRPSEAVTIAGEVKNLAAITASALSIQLSANSQNLYSATFDIPANGTHPFTVTTTAGTEGTYTLTGKVTQNNSTLVEIADQYEVASPKVQVQVSVQEVAGNEPFNINVEMKNEGKVAATTDARFTMQDASQNKTIDTQTITIPAGETKAIQYTQQITGDTIYTFTFTGDISQTITKTVVYGLGASVSVSASNIYPEGKVAIPVTITNIGSLDENVVVNYQLSALSSQLSASAKTYFIPKGGSITDTLYYDLTEGSYQLTASSQNPESSSQVNFEVRKENKVEMTVIAGVSNQVSGDSLMPVTINLTNLGYNEISGSVQLSAISGQGAAVWNGEVEVASLKSQVSSDYSININPSAIAPGDYTLKAELLNNSNQQIAVNSQPVTIKGAVFQISQLPSYQTFTVGQEASFTFKVKNTGNQEGAFDLNLKAYDMIDSTRSEWLKPNEEKDISFSFMLPEDIEEKDYYADYELKGSRGQGVEGSGIKGQVKYHVAGINLSVNATLDKQYYNEGETAHLTIVVSNQQSAVSQNLFARVNYNGYENQQAFTIGQGNALPLQFDIPLTQITGEKLFYGIYHESGRSMHLNSLYIYKAGDAITITTDKQVYNTGDVVAVALNSQPSALSGQMTLTGPSYEETFNFSGTAAKSFALPSTMTAGTYNISYELRAESNELIQGSHSIDVAGIQVKVLECKNDKGKYASSDTITTNFTISSNINMPAILKAWIVDPDGKYTSAGESNINLVSSENTLLTFNSSLLTSMSGIHRLVYGIYTGDMLLVSGSEAFDVGDAILLGLSTDKVDYPENTVPVQVKMSMFGTVDANLELQLDGTTVKNESVSLNGFETLDIALDTVKPGSHTLKGILTAGGLKSTKETSFVYGSNLPDLTTGIREQGLGVSKESTMQFTATVTNQGKTPSNETTISLSDNDSLIETKIVNALNSGESQEITFIWNVLGKAGEHNIMAAADADNSVIEFNEENNTSQMKILIPDVSLVTETDKDTYKIRQKVNINSFITNLTSAKTYQNLILVTSAKDPSGAEVFQKSTVIASLSPSWGTQYAETWNTSGLLLDGTYTITQTIFKEGDPTGSPYIQNSKLITLQKAPDFTLRTDTDYKKIKQGERATYIAYLEPVNGWNSAINLNLEGLPSGASVSFNPGSLIPPGEAITVVITTDATAAGIHLLNLIAEGIDEGETVTHALPLTLDVAGFGLSSEASGKTIKQLETATFEINVASLNGYEGEVALSIEGVPYGVKASFEFWDSPDSTAFQAGKSGTVPVISVPGNAKLTVLTSKYARPGTYGLIVTGDDGFVKHKLNLNLVLQSNPQISAGIITAQGPGPNNQAEIKVFNSTLQTVLDMTAFDTKYGANAVMADIDGDGYDEIIVSQGPDPKNSATLKAFRRNGTPIAEYTAFDTKYGLTLSSGDIDGDWKDEIIVGMGPDPKNPATIKILKYNGSGFTELMTQTVFDTKYGLNTAVGDVDGDGMQEIITTAGPGPDNPAIVKIWKKDGQNLSELYSFTAFDGSYGANIATGDIDGDGKAEMIVGTGPDPKNPAIVRIFKSDGTLIKELMPYDAKYGYGVTVASVDVDGDGRDEIITGLGPGPQNPSWVKVFRYDGSEVINFFAYPENSNYGVRTGTGRIGN